MNTKFRVWCKHFQEWEKDPILLSEIGTPYHYYSRRPPVAIAPDEHIIQHSTLVFDKDNEEIYEGDIVHFIDKRDDIIVAQDIGIVEFKNAAFIVNGKNFDKDSHYLGDYITEGDNTNLQIIGNIFENKDILEK